MALAYLSGLAYKGDDETAAVVQHDVGKQARTPTENTRKYHLELSEVPMTAGNRVECIVFTGRAAKKLTVHAIPLRPSYKVSYGSQEIDYQWIHVSTSASWISEAVKKASWGLYVGPGTANRRRDPP